MKHEYYQSDNYPTSNAIASNTDVSLSVFYITAPHEEENRGDTDYVHSLVRGITTINASLSINAPKVHLEYIKEPLKTALFTEYYYSRNEKEGKSL